VWVPEGCPESDPLNDGIPRLGAGVCHATVAAHSNALHWSRETSISELELNRITAAAVLNPHFEASESYFVDFRATRTLAGRRSRSFIW
jgi:hypothetical protein